MLFNFCQIVFLCTCKYLRGSGEGAEFYLFRPQNYGLPDTIPQPFLQDEDKMEEEPNHSFVQFLEEK